MTNLWVKIQILLGIKKAICRDCVHYIEIGLSCNRWGQKRVNYVTGDYYQTDRVSCVKKNRGGRCLGFEEVEE